MFIKHLKCVHSCVVPFNDLMFAFAYLLTKYEFLHVNMWVSKCVPKDRVSLHELTFILLYPLFSRFLFYCYQCALDYFPFCFCFFFRFIKNSYGLNSEIQMPARAAGLYRCAYVCSFRFISSEIKRWVLFFQGIFFFFLLVIATILVDWWFLFDLFAFDLPHLLCIQYAKKNEVGNSKQNEGTKGWLYTRFMTLDLKSTLEFIPNKLFHLIYTYSGGEKKLATSKRFFFHWFILSL